jgi:TrmH family RNA methyltransferase
VLAICKKIPPKPISGNVIILDDISNPGNLGTIIRSAVAFNYPNIIISKNTVDPYNEKVIRSTEGMIFKVNLIIADLTDEIVKLKKDNYKIFGTDVNGGSNPCYEPSKHALIIGSEATGMNQ